MLVTLVPVGSPDPPLLDYLSLVVGETLQCPTAVHPRPLSPDFTYDPLRRQNESTPLLDALVAERAEGIDGKVLGITDCDLFIPILTFVFGEAQLGGRAAVLSIMRLRQRFYGLPDDPVLLYQRAEKEALHELGHTFGLVHCPDYACVMHFSNSIEEVDLKGERYCNACAIRISAQIAG